MHASASSASLVCRKGTQILVKPLVQSIARSVRCRHLTLAMDQASAALSTEAPVYLTVHAHPATGLQTMNNLRQQAFPKHVHFLEPGATQPSSEQTQQSQFDGQLYMSNLGSSTNSGRVLLTTPEIGSTQDFMRAHQTLLPQGSVLVADRQVKGRGRGGNQWTSPAGCLMFTLGRAVKIPGNQAPFINYVVCLAVLRGIQEAVQIACPGAPKLDIGIKWPNDIYYAPKVASAHGGQSNTSTTSQTSSPAALPLKIGGALMHTTWSGGGFNLLVGIGLNVTNMQPTTCIQALLEQAMPGAPTVRPEVLLARIVTHLDECVQMFEEQGFQPLEADYLAAWMHSGQCVMFERDNEQSTTDDFAAGKLVALQIKGLSRSGFLLAVEEGTCKLYELTPDGNSLDMMAGLIRRKLP